jgi:hypothetical protein
MALNSTNPDSGRNSGPTPDSSLFSVAIPEVELAKLQFYNSPRHGTALEKGFCDTEGNQQRHREPQDYLRHKKLADHSDRRTWQFATSNSERNHNHPQHHARQANCNRSTRTSPRRWSLYFIHSNHLHRLGTTGSDSYNHQKSVAQRLFHSSSYGGTK